MKQHRAKLSLHYLCFELIFDYYTLPKRFRAAALTSRNYQKSKGTIWIYQICKINNAIWKIFFIPLEKQYDILECVTVRLRKYSVDVDVFFFKRNSTQNNQRRSANDVDSFFKKCKMTITFQIALSAYLLKYFYRYFNIIYTYTHFVSCYILAWVLLHGLIHFTCFHESNW